MDGPVDMANDLAAYLTHDKAVVERAMNLAGARQWIAAQPPVYIVVIDSADNNPPLDELRAAAHALPGRDAHFAS